MTVIVIMSQLSTDASSLGTLHLAEWHFLAILWRVVALLATMVNIIILTLWLRRRRE